MIGEALTSVSLHGEKEDGFPFFYIDSYDTKIIN